MPFETPSDDNDDSGRADNGKPDICHISITPAADERLSELQASSDTDEKLRVSVQAGGCSGFQYDFELTTSVEEDDLLIEAGSAKLVIDKHSARMLDGCELDHVSTLAGSSFRINFRQVSSQCSCGVSFAP